MPLIELVSPDEMFTVEQKRFFSCKQSVTASLSYRVANGVAKYRRYAED